jgi:hypothetical protein
MMKEKVSPLLRLLRDGWKVDVEFVQREIMLESSVCIMVSCTKKDSLEDVLTIQRAVPLKLISEAKFDLIKHGEEQCYEQLWQCYEQLCAARGI